MFVEHVAQDQEHTGLYFYVISLNLAYLCTQFTEYNLLCHYLVNLLMWKHNVQMLCR